MESSNFAHLSPHLPKSGTWFFLTPRDERVAVKMGFSTIPNFYGTKLRFLVLLWFHNNRPCVFLIVNDTHATKMGKYSSIRTSQRSNGIRLSEQNSNSATHILQITTSCDVCLRIKTKNNLFFKNFLQNFVKRARIRAYTIKTDQKFVQRWPRLPYPATSFPLTKDKFLSSRYQQTIDNTPSWKNEKQLTGIHSPNDQK